MYVECTSMLNNTPDNNLKQEASRYELRDGMLYNSELNTPVIITLDDLVATIESVHKDLQYTILVNGQDPCELTQW